MMISVTTCPACNNNRWSKHLECIDHTVSHETFTLTACVQCGLVATNPHPDAQSIGKYYQSTDYISHTNAASSLIDKIYLIARRFTLRSKHNLVTSFTPAKGKLLDYGCGTGHFLQYSKQKEWQISGVEPASSPRSIAALNTQEKIASDINDVSDQKFNAITLWHVLEHVHEPNVLLAKLHQLLLPHGTIFIAVPNHKSFDSEHYKSNWAGYDVPRHLWHFSDDNMKMIFEKNGLKLVDIVPMKLDAFYVSLLSEKHIHNGKTTLPSLIKAFVLGARSNFRASTTRQYSSLIYIGKKNVQ